MYSVKVGAAPRFASATVPVVAAQVNVPETFWSRAQFDAIPAPEKIFAHAPAAVVAPVPPLAVGTIPAATASEGVVVGFVTVGTNHEGHEPEGADILVTPLPAPPIALGTPLTHTYICVLGHPAKNTGNDPEQVVGTVGYDTSPP